MRLNFGCGKKVLPRFYNVDAVHHKDAPAKPELIHAITFKDGVIEVPLPLENETFEEVHSYHVLEHVFRWEADALVKEWKRLLQPGGKLVLELPNIKLAAQNLLNGMNDQMSMWPLYGDWNHKDPYMMHKHGYTPETLEQLLTQCGFINIKFSDPQTHGKRANRDMRVEANK